MLLFSWGALTVMSLVAAAFMFKFWTQTRTRMFALLGSAFSVLAINWAALALLQVNDESRHYVYLIRLVAFGLILAGIVDSNRQRR